MRKKSSTNTIDIATTINLFRTNVQKFEPLKKPEKKIIVETVSGLQNIGTNNEDTLFSAKGIRFNVIIEKLKWICENKDGDAFLTGVNIEERSVKGNIEDIGESNIEPNEPNLDQNEQITRDRDPTLQEVLSQELTGVIPNGIPQRVKQIEFFLIHIEKFPACVCPDTKPSPEGEFCG